MAGFHYRGPQCRLRLLPEIDNGTLCRGTTSAPGPTGNLGLFPDFYNPDFIPSALGMSVTEEDKSEFKIIKKMNVLDKDGTHFKGVQDYVRARTFMFGAHTAYQAYCSESDEELATTEWPRKKRKSVTLRSLIEFNDNTKKQQIFYRWVRKAYQQKYGDDVDVPELIHKGMSPQLEQKIRDVRSSARVTKIHDETFHAGGFNPRPQKLNKAYRLGTLSEHATGLAVDIDDPQNAQFDTRDWKFIENLVGQKLPQPDRKKQWKSKDEDDVTELWTAVHDISEAFVTKVASEVKRIEEERVAKAKKEKEEQEKLKAAGKASGKAEGDGKKDEKKKVRTPLEEVLGDHYKNLSPWVTTGFFHLPLELVLELHAHGFTWGATFSDPDLHHFELD
jgi:hypothetical protein